MCSLFPKVILMDVGFFINFQKRSYIIKYVNPKLWCEWWTYVLGSRNISTYRLRLIVFVNMTAAWNITPCSLDIWSAPWWWRHYAPVKRWSTSMRQHGALSQKAVIFHTRRHENLKSHLGFVKANVFRSGNSDWYRLSVSFSASRSAIVVSILYSVSIIDTQSCRRRLMSIDELHWWCLVLVYPYSFDIISVTFERACYGSKISCTQSGKKWGLELFWIWSRWIWNDNWYIQALRVVSTLW
jgi:hypothetical protein